MFSADKRTRLSAELPRNRDQSEGNGSVRIRMLVPPIPVSVLVSLASPREVLIFPVVVLQVLMPSLILVAIPLVVVLMRTVVNSLVLCILTVLCVEDGGRHKQCRT